MNTPAQSLIERRRFSTPFRYGLISVGLVACLFAAYRLPVFQLNARFLLLALLTILISSRIAIRLPGTSGEVTVSDTFIFLTILLYGGEAAILLAALEGASSSQRVSRKPVTIMVNLAIMACSTCLTVWTLRLFFGSTSNLPQHHNSATFLLTICLMALVQYAANSGLVAIDRAYKEDHSIWQMWKTNYLWTSVTYFAGASAAGIIFKLIDTYGFYAVTATLPIIAIVYFTHRTYLKNIEAAAEHTAQAERHVEELNLYIAERRQAEEALRQAEEKYRSIFENALEGIFQSTPEGQFISVNPAMARMFGYASPEEMIEERADIERQHYVAPLRRAEFKRSMAVRGLVQAFESQVYRKDGSHFWTSENVRAICNASGTVLYYEGATEDITPRKQVEEALRESEEQLRQSQKMEAVGQLAGGIAHDFNNLLTVITGYSELMLRRLKEDEPLRQNVEEIKKAGDRATSLTRQLLAFSRKQVLQLKVLGINTVVVDMNKMLRRLIGENIDLMLLLEPALWQVKADPGQIEQVLMNLAVNARDAMPEGGKLTIETENVELDGTCAQQHDFVPPGRYVMLAVSDTGCGMDVHTRERVFEPFFTTKEQGKGTGLGLSTVYGIVKQSGGHIYLDSEPGHGTTFKVYLPWVEQELESALPGADMRVRPRATETVLLAEDEEVVRGIIRDTLKLDGYHVLEAANGSEALRVSEQYEGQIHLVMTDVVMPQMGGRELAERLLPLRPEMKLLYMSGYTDDAIIHHGVSNQGTAFIQKPFTPDSIARKVREVLHGDSDDLCGMRRAKVAGVALMS